MPAAMDPQAIHDQTGNTANMAYTHCSTRVVNLVDFDIPDLAAEDEYRRLYHRVSSTQTSAARALTDAINSVSLGIAPPVAFPTETVYGLGADATNKSSIAGIFAAKGRPSDNPLIVHVVSQAHLERLTGAPIPAVYADLVREHWPGPLTILVPVPAQNSVFAPNVHPGQKTIGFRVPESKYARFFIAATGKPIAAPSANSSGRPSPTTAQHVMDDLRGKVNFILDGGSCSVGVESTVVDGLHDPPLILRPGGLSQDDLIAHGEKFGSVWARVKIGYKQHQPSSQTNGIKKTLGDIRDEGDDDNDDEAPRAPGMKYKHYAPRGRMILFEGSASDSADVVQHELDALVSSSPEGFRKNNEKNLLNVAILTTSTNWPTRLPALFRPTSTSSSSSSSVPTNGIDGTNGTDGTNDNDSSTTTPVEYGDNCLIHHIHLGSTPTHIARSLFAALRECDARDCAVIFAEAPLPGRTLKLASTHANAHAHAQLTLEMEAKNGTKKEDTGVEEGMEMEMEVEMEEGKKYHEYDAVLERMRKAATTTITTTRVA